MCVRGCVFFFILYTQPRSRSEPGRIRLLAARRIDRKSWRRYDDLARSMSYYVGRHGFAWIFRYFVMHSGKRPETHREAEFAH